MQDGKLTSRTSLESFKHLTEFHLSQFLNPILHVSQLVTEEGQFIQVLVELISFLEEWPADDLIEIEVPSLKGLIQTGHPVHLVIMRAVDQAAFTPCLLTYLAEERGGLFVVGAETG
jgi:hypothetical protein